MKRLPLLLLIGILVIAAPTRSHAQVQELEQLALDIEKLAQMKSILTEMYKGYQILTGGYNTIKSLAEGNFNLHAAYLNGLLQVSPAVKNYVRVADIIASQATLITEYKSALKTFAGSGQFSAAELNYLTGVYSNLFNKSLDNLDELVMVLTDSQLRANDAERLNTIDHIYDDMQDKLSFLRMFNGHAGILAAQRQHDLQDINNLKSLIGQ
jgi:flagellar biosynthesis/type III secretory pathway chaperone